MSKPMVSLPPGSGQDGGLPAVSSGGDDLEAMQLDHSANQSVDLSWESNFVRSTVPHETMREERAVKYEQGKFRSIPVG